MTTTQPGPVAVLGLGPMGRALAGAFLRAGHPTTVWNRTPGKDNELAAAGAVGAASAAQAVAAGELAVVCVLDARAVHAVLDAAGPEALRGRTVLNLSGDTPLRARELAARAEAEGFGYLDGAILTPPPQGTFLISGDPGEFARHRATLRALGAGVTHVGADPGRAAAFDVALLDFFWAALAGMVHAFALARAEGVAAGELAGPAGAVAGLLPELAAEIARHLEEERFPGDASTLLSAEAVTAHVLEATRASGLDDGLPAAVHRISREAVAAGHGAEGYSRVAALLAARAGNAPRPAA